MLVSFFCILSLFLVVGGLIYLKYVRVFRYKLNVIGKCGYFYVNVGRKVIKMRILGCYFKTRMKI